MRIDSRTAADRSAESPIANYNVVNNNDRIDRPLGGTDNKKKNQSMAEAAS